MASRPCFAGSPYVMKTQTNLCTRARPGSIRPFLYFLLEFKGHATCACHPALRRFDISIRLCVKVVEIRTRLSLQDRARQFVQPHYYSTHGNNVVLTSLSRSNTIPAVADVLKGISTLPYKEIPRVPALFAPKHQSTKAIVGHMRNQLPVPSGNEVTPYRTNTVATDRTPNELCRHQTPKVNSIEVAAWCQADKRTQKENISSSAVRRHLSHLEVVFLDDHLEVQPRELAKVSVSPRLLRPEHWSHLPPTTPEKRLGNTESTRNDTGIRSAHSRTSTGGKASGVWICSPRTPQTDGKIDTTRPDNNRYCSARRVQT